jgi:hypothetical protein
MSGGDLVSTLSMNTADFTAPITDAIAHLKGLADSAVASMQTVTSSIVPANAAMQSHSEVVARQSKEWKSHGAEGSSSLFGFARAVGFATGVTGGLLRIVALWVPSLRSAALAMSAVGIATGVAGSISDHNAAQTRRAAQAHEDMARSAKKSKDESSSLATVIGSSAVVAAIAYKVVLQDVIEASAKHLKSDSAVRKGVGELSSELAKAANTGLNLYSSAIKASLLATIQFTTGFQSIEEIVDYGASTLAKWASTGAEALKTVTEYAKEAALQFSGMIASFQSGGGFDIAGFVAEGRELNKLEEDSQKTMTGQQELAKVLGSVNGAFNAAATQQRVAGEQARIASITNVAAIDAEIQALKLLIRERQNKDGSIDKGQTKEDVAISEALGKQKLALETGKVKSPIAEAMADLEKQYQKLTLGESEYAIAEAKAKGASEEEIQSMRDKQAAIKGLTDAQKAQKAAEDVARQAAEKRNQLNDQAATRTAKLRDEIDLLNGTATKAEIAMRDMARQGFTSEQVAEAGKLEEELERLRGGKKDQSGSDKDSGQSEAKLAGSSDAASIFLRGVGGANPTDIAKKSLSVQERSLTGIERMATSLATWLQPPAIASIK